MVKSYCVKQKKQTECVEPSGYKKAKNGRLTFFCICAECGITKTKFVKSQSTSGGNVLSKPYSKPYCGINKVPKGKHRGNEMECITQNQIRQYENKKADKSVIENIKNFRKNIKIKPKTAKSIKKSEELTKEMIKLIEKQINQGN